MLEIGMIVFLLMVSLVLIISFALTFRAKNKYNKNIITRGMNGMEGQTINLSCPSGQVISFRTGRTPSSTTRGAIVSVGDTATCDAFYQPTGQNQNFFNPTTTVDVFSSPGQTEYPEIKGCEGKQICSFSVPTKQEVASRSPGLCIGTSSGSVAFIGTYDCIPK